MEGHKQAKNADHYEIVKSTSFYLLCHASQTCSMPNIVTYIIYTSVYLSRTNAARLIVFIYNDVDKFLPTKLPTCSLAYSRLLLLCQSLLRLLSLVLGEPEASSLSELEKLLTAVGNALGLSVNQSLG